MLIRSSFRSCLILPLFLALGACDGTSAPGPGGGQIKVETLATVCTTDQECAGSTCQNGRCGAATVAIQGVRIVGFALYDVETDTVVPGYESFFETTVPASLLAEKRLTVRALTDPPTIGQVDFASGNTTTSAVAAPYLLSEEALATSTKTFSVRATPRAADSNIAGPTSTARIVIQ